ncbi:MAG: FAD-dependent oxidoreductase [Pseudomonadota bacterium]
MTHVVVLGAGIAGIPAAYALKSGLGRNDEVTVVSDKDYFHFVPSNPWIAMGWRNRADIAFPVAPYLEARGIGFVHSRARRIQPDRNTVELENGKSLSYDYLLVATGAEGAFDEIPGLAEHTHSVLHVEQAERAHAAYREFARHPAGPIVVGAAQNSSILGPVYEFAFLADADLKRRNIRSRVPITLVTPEPWPGHLGLGDAGANREAIEAALADNDISIICNARTERITADAVHIVELDEAGKDRQAHTLPFAYSVYWPAFRGVAGVRDCVGLANGRGLVVVDEYLRNPAHPNVYAVGVCAAHGIVDRTPLNVGAPASVYSIQKEVETAVGNIHAAIHGESLLSNVPQRARWLSDMGKDGAAYLSGPQVPLRDINWMRQGRWVHLAKVDFEKYFLNKVRLKPAGEAPAAASEIADVMGRSLAEKIEGVIHPSPAEPGAKSIDVRLGREAYFELRALARSVGRESGALAADLLSAALADAKACLNEAGIDALERARRELRVAELPERQPGVEFHGGGT